MAEPPLTLISFYLLIYIAYSLLQPALHVMSAYSYRLLMASVEMFEYYLPVICVAGLVGNTICLLVMLQVTLIVGLLANPKCLFIGKCNEPSKICQYLDLHDKS